MCEIIYECHSTSLDNEKGIASGHLDPFLSEKGKEQALQLGKRYAHFPPQFILCSDLRRSYETAQIAFPNVPLIKSPDLREWDYGDYNGKQVQEVDSLKTRYTKKPFPGGEALENVIDRVWNYINQQLEIFPQERIMIIAHRSTFYSLEYWIHHRSFECILSAPWKWQEGWIYIKETD